jgi:hypothetical protein
MNDMAGQNSLASQDSAKHQLPSLVSATGMMTDPCERLKPATLKQGKSELGACLTLVSPSGLSADDRKEWLAVAMQTLSGIPADLLERGCQEARRRCRFPSEIVPTIIQTIERQWQWRLADQRNAMLRLVPPEPEPEYVDPKQVRELIKNIGSAA